MLQPKRTKYRKVQKGRVKGLDHRGSSLTFGTFGLKILEPVWLTARQIEAVRVAMTRVIKKKESSGEVFRKIFPDKPITKKPNEVRMGKGKGSPEYWAAVVRPGRILFETEGVDINTAREAIKLAIDKLPVKAKFVVHREYYDKATSDE